MKGIEARNTIDMQCDGTPSPHPRAILKHHVISAEFTRMVGVVRKITPEHGSGTVSLLNEEMTRQQSIWV
jgi:hypothetical protein